MSIKRAYSKDLYTVARIINLDDGATARTDVEYKRGVGTVKPDNLTSMLTSSGSTSLLVNTNLYTKQAFPLVADAVQGYDSDYFMWTDIDNTARWYQASGWRDWSRNGQNSYQQVLGTYDAEFLNPALIREQDLTFCEIDNMSEAIGSTTRVVDLKMGDIQFKNYPIPIPSSDVADQRYVYNLNGTTDFLGYNSLDTTKPDTNIPLKRGNNVKLKYLANTEVTGTGETVMKQVDNQYIRIPDFTTDINNPDYNGVVINMRFKVSTADSGKERYLISGTSPIGEIWVQTTEDNRIKVVAPQVPTNTSVNTFNLDVFNNISIVWNVKDESLKIFLNGQLTLIGFHVFGVVFEDITFKTLGGNDTRLGEENFTGFFDGVLKDVVFTKLVPTGDPTPPIDREYPIDEITIGSVNDISGNEKDGIRVNMTNNDINIITSTRQFLFSGIGADQASLAISNEGKLETTNSTWIDTIKYDGVAIDILTFEVPKDNLVHEIEVECAEVCNIAKLAADEGLVEHYKGYIYDFSVTKGKQETVWEIKTYAGMKQDPLTLTALSFGFNQTNYTNDNWSLITIGQK